MDFNLAIRRPFQDVTKLIIGCALNIVPIVNFLSMGYVLKSGSMTLKGNNKLPEWQDWGDLFVKGLFSFIIGLIWLIPAIVLGAIGGGAAFASVLTAGVSGGLSLGGLAGAGLLFLLAGLLGLIAAYFLPIAILGYVKTDKFGAAFDFSTVFKKALSGEYFVAWIISVVVALVLGIVGGIIPYLSIVLSPAASFISMMIGITLIGSVYNKL